MLKFKPYRKAIEPTIIIPPIIRVEPIKKGGNSANMAKYIEGIKPQIKLEEKERETINNNKLSVKSNFLPSLIAFPLPDA